VGKRGWIKTPEEVKRFAKENDDISNKGAYCNLMNQLNKIAKHAKGISITSQRQYYNHMDKFLRYVADHYNLKSLANIQDKHLVSYVIERQNEGKSAATVKQDLAAIRYFHNQLPKARYTLSDNERLKEKFPEFSLEKRSFGGINRRCTEAEYQALVNIAHSKGYEDTARMIQLMREQGLRVHEVTRLSRADAEKALRDGFLTVKGKGGLVREVPLRNVSRGILRDAMRNVDRGQKLFVKPHEKAHTVIQRVKDFVKNHRDKVLDPYHGRPNGVNITCHSFRHAYAKEEYDRRIAAGMTEKEARYEVSELIGHSRDDVTRIYLGE
jgi:integrase/recombinase XerD